MSGSKRIAKFAASTNAHDRCLFPFFVLPLPLRLPLESFSLPTHRQYEAKFPTCANLLISPVSSMIVSARIFPIPTNGKQIPIRRLQSDSIFHGPFQTCDLGFECSHDRQIRFHRQSQIQLTNSRSDPKASPFEQPER